MCRTDLCDRCGQERLRDVKFPGGVKAGKALERVNGGTKDIPGGTNAAGVRGQGWEDAQSQPEELAPIFQPRLF